MWHLPPSHGHDGAHTNTVAANEALDGLGVAFLDPGIEPTFTVVDADGNVYARPIGRTRQLALGRARRLD